MPRAITQWSITAPQTDASKDDLAQFICNAWDGWLLAYVISIEPHHDGGYHLHGWIQFNEDHQEGEGFVEYCGFDSVATNLEVFFDKRVNVEACKSRKSWLKYITKEDCEPVFSNISPSDFSLYYKVNAVARVGDHKWFHPLSVEHMNTGHVLQRTWEERRMCFISDATCSFIPHPLTHALGSQPWQRLAVNVINDYIRAPVFKQRQLYLYGPPNCGKTTWVLELLGLMDWRPFYPLRFKSPFWIGCLDQRYNCIVVDDFREEQFDTGELLTLLQGGWTVKQRKGRDPEDIRWRKPVILTSNVPFSDLSAPLQARLAGLDCSSTNQDLYDLLGL